MLIVCPNCRRLWFSKPLPPLDVVGAPSLTTIGCGRHISKNNTEQPKWVLEEEIPCWSVYDSIKIIPSKPEALMSEINSGISSLEYAKSTGLLL
ncbi:hypothetical protein L1987_53374 [Smallanthus sonchifolius]|uniref:Uncharacterized protein n=1 Tax=Smallanthus sonchifolius TaxID=185202 RepID=A0ACB9EVR3_9ASTR|nr:hypothetical protein L1987_53374 [Smallanthus sonchifolius]